MSENEKLNGVRSPNWILVEGIDPPKPPKGVHPVKKTLRDGRVVIYDYAWKSGPPLVGLRASPEYLASHKEALARRPEVKDAKDEPETVGDLIHKYKETTAYTDLADETKRARGPRLDAIKKEFGDFPISAFSDRRSRGKFKEWRETIVQGTWPPVHPKIAEKLRAKGKPVKRRGSRAMADRFWEDLNRVLNWSLWDMGYIESNPCLKGGRLYHGNRREKIWTADREHRFFYKNPEKVFVPARVAYQRTYYGAVWSGQRAWDIVDLRWSNYDGEYLRLQQHKRPRPDKPGKRVTIKVAAPLKAMLDQMEIEAGVVGLSTEERHEHHIFLNNDGRPWKNSRSFSSGFAKAAHDAGVTDRTFHDLRGTAVVRFALADASVPQIMAITGHSLGDIKSIFEANYLHLDQSLGDAAVAKRERAAAAFPTDVPTALPTDPNRSLSVQQEKEKMLSLIREIEELEKSAA